MHLEAEKATSPAYEQKLASSCSACNHILVTVKEAEQMLKLSRSTIYVILDRGDIPSLKIGRARRIRRSDLEEWAKGRLENDRA
jgi:excisionase family DNA binding protein